jgi:hypothetical protein
LRHAGFEGFGVITRIDSQAHGTWTGRPARNGFAAQRRR